MSDEHIESDPSSKEGKDAVMQITQVLGVAHTTLTSLKSVYSKIDKCLDWFELTLYTSEHCE